MEMGVKIIGDLKNVAYARKLLLIIACFCCLQLPSLAAFSELSPSFLRGGFSARSLAMGGVYAAVGNDPNAVFTNPAAIPFADGFNLTADQTLARACAAYVYPLSETAGLGFGIAYKNLQNITLNSGEVASSASQMFMLSYGVSPTDRLSLGLTLKYMPRQTYEQGAVYETISGYDGDLGLLWKSNDWLNIGATISNFLESELPEWPTGSQRALRLYRIGAAAQVIGDVASPLYIENRKLILASAVEWSGTTALVELGGEYSIDGKMYIRAGINNFGIQGGLGLKLGKISLDLASVYFASNAERVLFMSLGYSPGEWSFQKKNVPGWVAEGLFLDEISLHDNRVTYDEAISIKGKLKKGVSLKINSTPIYVAPEGTFLCQIPLRAGKNLVVLETAYGAEKKTYNYKVLRKVKVVVVEEKQLNLAIASAEGSRKLQLEKEKQLILEKKRKLEVLVTMGVIEVKPNTDFKLDAAITRGELASWIVKAGKLPLSPVNENVFKDVLKNDPQAYYIKTVTDQHLMTGYSDGTFRPNQPVTEDEGRAIFQKFGVIK